MYLQHLHTDSFLKFCAASLLYSYIVNFLGVYPLTHTVLKSNNGPVYRGTANSVTITRLFWPQDQMKETFSPNASFSVSQGVA